LLLIISTGIIALVEFFKKSIIFSLYSVEVSTIIIVFFLLCFIIKSKTFFSVLSKIIASACFIFSIFISNILLFLSKSLIIVLSQELLFTKIVFILVALFFIKSVFIQYFSNSFFKNIAQ
jgi:hypothetical protein